MRAKGSYVLLIFLDNDASIVTGKLGTFTFPCGYYLYTGSALGGLRGRINRHLTKDKKSHWHIDYLLMHSRIIEVWVVLAEERLECLMAQTVLSLPGAMVPAVGFGSSDCRCRAHLVHFPEKPELETFQTAVGTNITLERLSISDLKVISS
jgi:sugar fermentation stimulation protein A